MKLATKAAWWGSVLGVTAFGYKTLFNHTRKAAVLNAMTKQSDFTVTKNICYGLAARQVLDVYQPKCAGGDKNKHKNKHNHHTADNEKLPVLFFVHGGSWKTGSKDDYVFLAESFTSAGFVVVIINYHLAPVHVYPSYVQDTALALKWVHEHIADYAGDAEKLFAMGHSAGAFNLLAAVNDARFFDELQLPNNTVKAVIGIAGPYSYDFTTDETAYAFPQDGVPAEIMPNHVVRENPVPHLLLTAEKDTTVEPFNATDMYHALEEKGADVTLTEIQKANHISVIAVFAKRLSFVANTRAVVLDYIKGYF